MMMNFSSIGYEATKQNKECEIPQDSSLVLEI